MVNEIWAGFFFFFPPREITIKLQLNGNSDSMGPHENSFLKCLLHDWNSLLKVENCLRINEQVIAGHYVFKTKGSPLFTFVYWKKIPTRFSIFQFPITFSTLDIIIGELNYLKNRNQVL